MRPNSRPRPGQVQERRLPLHHGTSQARFATIRTDPAGQRERLGAERPGLVVFETRTVTGRVADPGVAPRLHSRVANSMHEVLGRSRVERHTKQGADDAEGSSLWSG